MLSRTCEFFFSPKVSCCLLLRTFCNHNKNHNKAHMSQFKWGKLIECHNYSSYVGDCGDRKYNKYMVEEE